MIDKKDLLSLFTSENQTTLNVIKAVPEGHMEFKPAEKSNSLHALLVGFVVGNQMLQSFLKGEQGDASLFGTTKFNSVIDATVAYEHASAKFLSDLESADEADVLQPFSMWGMEGSRADIMLGMLRDTIHHRGQLTVYIRLLNGKVPSVYGPTADEPMNS